MTSCEAEELLPLLNDKKSDKSNYSNFNGNNKTENTAFENDSFEEAEENKKETVVWIPTIEPTRKQANNNNAVTDRGVAYSWNKINVFVPAKIKKRIFAWWKVKHGNNREFYDEDSKHILKNAYGSAEPGELLAIMGSSGAGKTTLLNTLTFQTKGSIVKGHRYLNGCLINNKNTITKLSAYVEQDNLFLGTLTVKEHLIFQSLVRMGKNIPYRQKLLRVEDVITELKLEKCQNTVIGYPGRIKGISGGEMRKLSFASEVLTNPPLMFCDEPTSGLDSFNALNVITVLKALADRGKTIICTIHQPSSEIYSLFDKILLMAEGRTAFLGKPTDAFEFFSGLGASPLDNYNPADFYIQLLAIAPNREESCKEQIKLICDSFDESPYGLRIISKTGSDTQNQEKENLKNWEFFKSAIKEPTYAANWCLQFRAVFWRCCINIIREPLLVKVRLFQTVVLSLVIGLIYHDQNLNKDGVMNINGVIFTFLTNMTFQNIFGVISAFCSELPIFLKENSNKKYRVDVYFLSKTLAELPIFIIIPIILTSIVYFWINLNPTFYHFILAVLILILVANVATSFGYFISCISKNVVMALNLGPPVIIPFLLFGGFLLNAGAIPSYFTWLSYLSWFKYGYEGLLVNQWADIKSINCSTTDTTCPKTGQIVLQSYNFETNNLWLDIILLFVLILFFRFLAFFALFCKTIRYQKP